MDMLQTYKIFSGKEKVDPNCWFTKASDSERVCGSIEHYRPGEPIKAGHKEVFVLSASCRKLKECPSCN
jgi:hypothetical protein